MYLNYLNTTNKDVLCTHLIVKKPIQWLNIFSKTAALSKRKNLIYDVGEINPAFKLFLKSYEKSIPSFF